MALSRKNYEQIAAAISEILLEPDERVALVHRLCREFAEDNPRFDPDRFADACGLPREQWPGHGGNPYAV